MWTIGELKQKAKRTFAANYWKSVLAALLLAIGVSGFGSSASSAVRAGAAWYDRGSTSFVYNFNGHHGSGFGPGFWPMIPWFAGALIAAFFIIILIRAALAIFVCAPLEVGARRWFVVNRATGDASTSELLHGFVRAYGNVVKTMLLRWLYIFLWSLLLVVPGIMKSYSYRLVPYIIAESPDMDTREAFRLSREMMEGNKWHAFLLDLSFLGWDILNACTLGILGLFYVAPYQAQTSTELYCTLRDQYLGRM